MHRVRFPLGLRPRPRYSASTDPLAVQKGDTSKWRGAMRKEGEGKRGEEKGIRRGEHEGKEGRRREGRGGAGPQNI